MNVKEITKRLRDDIVELYRPALMKQDAVEELMKDNATLKARWEELKRWGFVNRMGFFTWCMIEREMQELEKEVKQG